MKSYRYRSEDGAYRVIVSFVNQRESTQCFIKLRRREVKHWQPMGSFFVGSSLESIMSRNPDAKRDVRLALSSKLDWTGWKRFKDVKKAA